MISRILSKLRARFGRRKTTAPTASRRSVVVRAGATANEGNADTSRVGLGYDAAVHGEDLDLEATDAPPSVASLESAAVPPRIVVETTVNGADPDDEPVDPVSPGKDLLDDMAHVSRDARA